MIRGRDAKEAAEKFRELAGHSHDEEPAPGIVAGAGARAASEIGQYVDAIRHWRRDVVEVLSRMPEADEMSRILCGNDVAHLEAVVRDTLAAIEEGIAKLRVVQVTVDEPVRRGRRPDYHVRAFARTFDFLWSRRWNQRLSPRAMALAYLAYGWETKENVRQLEKTMERILLEVRRDEWSPGRDDRPVLAEQLFLELLARSSKTDRSSGDR